jgi:calcineurin-like phosphoesterase family protein
MFNSILFHGKGIFFLSELHFRHTVVMQICYLQNTSKFSLKLKLTLQLNSIGSLNSSWQMGHWLAPASSPPASAHACCNDFFDGIVP